MNNLILVDANYTLKRCMYSKDIKPTINHKEMRIGGSIGFLLNLSSTLEKLSAKYCVLVWDGGISKRRLERFPGYKRTRYLQSQDQDSMLFRDVFKEQKGILKEIALKLGVSWIELKGREADDVIYKMIDTFPVGGRTFVASEDKDLFQSCMKGATVFRPFKNDMITPNNFERLMGIPINKYILWRAIVGERSRNDVDGVPGIGSVTATDLLKNDNVSDFASMAVHCIQEDASKKEEDIINFFEVICRNIYILDLGKEEFSVEDELEMREQVMETTTTFDEKDVRDILIRNEMESLLSNFTKFIRPFRKLESLCSQTSP